MSTHMFLWNEALLISTHVFMERGASNEYPKHVFMERGASNEHPQHMFFMENLRKLSQNYYHIQSNLNGSNIFGTMEIRSRHG